MSEYYETMREDYETMREDYETMIKESWSSLIYYKLVYKLTKSLLIFPAMMENHI